MSRVTESDIIRNAEALSEMTAAEFTSEYKHDGKALAAAMEVIANHGMADEQDGAFWRVDRFYAYQDHNGFVRVFTCSCAADASNEMFIVGRVTTPDYGG